MHMALETDKTKDTTKEKLGKVIFYLLKDKHLSKENINYARRIQKKLVPPKPLLDVLKELDYVNDDKINHTIKTHRANMKIGTLLVELGLIAHEDLDDALKIQYEEKKEKLEIFL